MFPALLFPAAESIMDLTNGVRPRDKKEDRTMTDNDVEKVMARLVNVFSQEFGATLR